MSKLLMEKQASRAWRKNIGSLSEQSKQRLIDSKILDYKKDLKGLNKGTKNILEKNNVKQISPRQMIKWTGNKPAVKSAAGYTSSEGKYVSFGTPRKDDRTAKKAIRMFKNNKDIDISELKNARNIYKKMTPFEKNIKMEYYEDTRLTK